MRLRLDYTDSDGDSIAITEDPLEGDPEDLLVWVRSVETDQVVVVRLPLALLRTAVAEA